MELVLFKLWVKSRRVFIIEKGECSYWIDRVWMAGKELFVGVSSEIIIFKVVFLIWKKYFFLG